ncbi:MAG: diaminohydroxyphosphoribosylaminopyrimidine deaminase [Maricaulis sp.]|jgi:diaminohydroxyphosphoribosylaminopyrimidine deaminase/5-amino-6-(5-phosphoribosylamino)uracil reductase
MSKSADHRFMDTALALARSQLGRTAPNPAVGCVLVRDGKIVGCGATADGGRPHAERLALDQAGELARGARAYVTLEPCAFHGQTPPCATALIEAGLESVVIACADQHPKVSGHGIALLRNAGLHVETELRQAEAETLNEGFFHRIRTGQPKVYLDANAERYDAALTIAAGAPLGAALDQLGEAGMNRVCVAPGSALAARLIEAGLVVRPAGNPHTGR